MNHDLEDAQTRDRLDLLRQHIEDAHALDEEQMDLVAERGSVCVWLVPETEVENLLRKGRELAEKLGEVDW